MYSLRFVLTVFFFSPFFSVYILGKTRWGLASVNPLSRWSLDTLSLSPPDKKKSAIIDAVDTQYLLNTGKYVDRKLEVKPLLPHPTSPFTLHPLPPFTPYIPHKSLRKFSLLLHFLTLIPYLPAFVPHALSLRNSPLSCSPFNICTLPTSHPPFHTSLLFLTLPLASFLLSPSTSSS